jgi:hypothetical protein
LELGHRQFTPTGREDLASLPGSLDLPGIFLPKHTAITRFANAALRLFLGFAHAGSPFQPAIITPA